MNRLETTYTQYKHAFIASRHRALKSMIELAVSEGLGVDNEARDRRSRQRFPRFAHIPLSADSSQHQHQQQLMNLSESFQFDVAKMLATKTEIEGIVLNAVNVGLYQNAL